MISVPVTAPTLVGSTFVTANAAPKPLAGPIDPPRTEPAFSAEAIQLQRRMRFNPLRSLDPENLSLWLDQFDIGILRQAALLWDAMCRRDDTLSFVKPQLENAIAGKPWGVFKRKNVDETEAARHAAALEYFYDHVTAVNAFDRNEKGGRHRLLKQMGECFAYKYAVHHFVWQRTPGKMIEVEGAQPVPALTAMMEYVPLWFFENVSGTLRFLPFGGFGVDGQALNWNGEWICTTGQGIMFAASICYVFKRLTFQDWTVFNERYAQQKPVGMTNAKKDDEAGQSMASIIDSFNSDMGIVFYECTNTEKPPVQLLGPEGTVSVDLFERFLDRQDRKLAVMFRGSDLRNMSREKDTTGVSAQSDETDALEIAHCANIADSCREIDRQVIRYCFGEGVEPLAYFGLPEMDDEDATTVRENAGFLADRGALVELDTIAERLGITLTDKPEDALQPVGGAATAPEDATAPADGRPNATANAKLRRLRELVEESLRTANMNPNHDPGTGEFSSGGGAGGDDKARRIADRARKKSALSAENQRSIIKDVVARSSDDSDHEGEDFGAVSDDAVAKAADAGQDIKGFTKRIEPDAVRHVLSRHGDQAIELSRNQVPVADEDFERLPEIFDSPDTVRAGEPDPDGSPTLFFEKKLGENYRLLAHVRRGKRRLGFKTLMKERSPAAS